MRFGIGLQGDKAPAEYVALAELIDRYGFDVVSVYNDVFCQPAFGPLAVMAPHIRRAWLGPAALNPYTLHPVEIAGQMAFLDLLTGGRAYLGLARGAWLDQIGVVQHRPLQTLRDAIVTIKRMLAGDTLRYQRVRSEIPITLGTWSPRTARLAGELADEVKVGGSANSLMAKSVRPFIAEGARRAERDPDSVGLCLGAVTVVSADRNRARALARREVALYAPVVAPLDPSLREEEWVVRIAEPARLHDYTQVARLIPDAALDRLAFAGAPADIVRQVEDLAAAGVTRVEFGTPHGLDSFEGIRFLGEQVLRSFRS